MSTPIRLDLFDPLLHVIGHFLFHEGVEDHCLLIFGRFCADFVDFLGRLHVGIFLQLVIFRLELVEGGTDHHIGCFTDGIGY